MTTKIEEDPIVKRKIGNKYLIMHQSNMLSSHLNNFPLYDRALPRICQEIKKIDGYLIFVDVGANIGDSISLICDKVSGSFLCIEGDKEYLPLLITNTSQLTESEVFIEECFCSENDSDNQNLKIERKLGNSKIVQVNEGGNLSNTQFKTLDNIIRQYPNFEKANLVKIDTEGFEINVLKGGEGFIKTTRPILYFEFTPELYLNNNQDPMFIFNFLDKNGYHEALMYDNFGKPLEIIETSDQNRINKLLTLIDNDNIYYYDILTYHISKKEKYGDLFEKEFVDCIALLYEELIIVKSERDRTKTELVSSQTELGTTKIELETTKTELRALYTSLEWKVTLMIRKIVTLLIPKGSRRRKILFGF